MHNHLQLHNLEHKQHIKYAQQQQLADELRQAKTKAQPNQTLFQFGEMLVDLGERLQKSAYQERHA